MKALWERIVLVLLRDQYHVQRLEARLRRAEDEIAELRRAVASVELTASEAKGTVALVLSRGDQRVRQA